MKSTALASLLRSISGVLSIAGTLVCQFPCSGASAPAFFITCPCNGGSYGYGDISIDMRGQGRIGTVQQIYTTLDPNRLNFLFIGTPSLAPVPIPPGIAICNNMSANIPSIQIDPLFSYTFFGPQPGGTLYWLMVPNDPQLIGVTIAAQAFQQQWGQGAVPFNASALLGFTIAQ